MKNVPPPVLAFAAGLAQRAMSPHATSPTMARRSLAGATTLASMVLGGSTARLFRRTGTTIDPLDPSRASALVTTGANAFTRNPMYVGLAGVLVANAVRRGSWAALVPVAGFVLAIDRWQIRAEESALLSNFGADYASYRASVPRWLGPRRA
jgi:protein-S-isoprenylcysteine O-methyltransferase Ste14